ncbi:hypothetical protein [Polaromonas sp. SM01]|uniref:hypothetical protein n=1 Tax=Polaromonas sp. SM01 TaxID=3085630 RepID=UPI00298146B3|nr:hypothetical protein [Polaromonas sp. SM01]MDW5441179.1 hypothetical protein [Polaromonas sp. SM01]
MIPLIDQYLSELAAFDGIQGCSLVECSSGLVLHSAGEFADVEPLSEAAVEFWRIHARVKENLVALGRLNLAMLAFQNGWLALTACPSDPSLLLVAVTRTQAVDWQGWLRHARASGPFAEGLSS